MLVECYDCGHQEEFSSDRWRCDCGGAWEVANRSPFDPNKINPTDYSIWRYGKLLGLDVRRPAKAMGVGWTPLVPIALGNLKVYIKLEFLSPSGSFKDRGVNAMVNQLAYMGIDHVIEDSSGNAGASVAAHAARFGIKARVFVPATASPAKLRQIEVYHAEVVSINGPRKDVTEAALKEINPNNAYASHAFHPAYLSGQLTAAYELWEQLGRKVPDWIICPVAQGGQFLGFYLGFKSIYEAGFSKRLPRLVAVQSKAVAPIYHAWENGLDHIPEIINPESTIAEGIAITRPVRDRRLLGALHETGGEVVIVSESEIISARDQLAKKGFYIEPTSAVALAGFEQLRVNFNENENIVIPLTGNGLKDVPRNGILLNNS